MSIFRHHIFSNETLITKYGIKSKIEPKQYGNVKKQSLEIYYYL